MKATLAFGVLIKHYSDYFSETFIKKCLSHSVFMQKQPFLSIRVLFLFHCICLRAYAIIGEPKIHKAWN